MMFGVHSLPGMETEVAGSLSMIPPALLPTSLFVV